MTVKMKKCFKALRKKIVLLALLNLIVIGISYYLPSLQAGGYDFQADYTPTQWVLRFRLLNITLFVTPPTEDVTVRLIIPGVLNETVASFEYVPGLLFYEPNALLEKTLDELRKDFSPNIDVRLDLSVPGYHPAIPTYAYHRRDGVWELRLQSPGYLDAYAELEVLMKDPFVSVTNNGGLTGIVRLTGKSPNQSKGLEVEVPPHGVADSVMEGVFTNVEADVRLYLINRLLCFSYFDGTLYFALRDNMILVIPPLLLADSIYLLQACRKTIEGAKRGTKKI